MKKFIFYFLAALVILVGTAWITLNFFILDSEKISGEIKTVLESASGREVTIASKGEVKFFPPQITYPGIKIKNIKGASAREFFTAPSVKLSLDIPALFTMHLKPSEIVFDGALIDFENLPGGVKNWQFTQKEGEKKSGPAFREYFAKVPIKLQNSVWRYVNSATGAQTEFSGINGTIYYDETGKTIVYSGLLLSKQGDAEITAKMQAADLTQPNVPNVPLEITLKQGTTDIKASGELISASRDPEFSGKIEITAPNISNVAGIFIPLTTLTVKQETATEKTDKFTANGNITVSIDRLLLTDFSMLEMGSDTIPIIKGTINAEYRFGKNPVFKVAPHFESIDLDSLRKTLNDLQLAIVGNPPESSIVQEKIGEKDNPETFASAQSGNENVLKKFLSLASGEVNLNIDNMIYNSRSIKSVLLQTSVDKGIVTLNAVRANFPGETWLVFSGIARITDNGVLYEGKTELQGQKMEEFLGLFAPGDVSMPTLELGMFALRSNIAGTPEQLRFSEMQARIKDTRLAGALIFHLKDRVQLESFLRVAGINLDTIKTAVDYVLPKNEGVQQVASQQGEERLFNMQYINNHFRWLSTIPIDIDADLLLEDFILFERQGDRAQFKLSMKMGQIGLYNMNAHYNGADITGNYALHVEREQNPSIDINGSISELNLADIFPRIAHVQNQEEWEKFLDESIDLKLLQSWQGSMNAKIDKLILRNYQFENVDLAAKLDKNRLEIDRINGKLWNGNVQFRAAVQAGTIPSFSISFVLDNANLVRLSQMTALVKHAAGQLGIRGQLATSGVSLQSWFKNATGAVSVIGQEVSVQGFGLATLARAVPVARAVADLINAKRAAMEGGVARLNSLESQLTVTNGLLEVTRAIFTSEEATGSVGGKVDLMHESIDLAAEFYLISTVESGQNPPKMTLTLKGPIDNVQKELEMQQMEAYVARKAAERTLQMQ